MVRCCILWLVEPPSKDKIKTYQHEQSNQLPSHHPHLPSQEPVLPPRGCPAGVRALLGAASEAHAARDCDRALDLLAAAQEEWEALLEPDSGDDDKGGSGDDCDEEADEEAASDSDGELGGSGGGKLRAAARRRRRRLQRLAPRMALFFGMAAAGALLSAGRDEAAWETLAGSGGALAWLHEAGADAAAWHGAAGVVAYHLGELQVGWCDLRLCMRRLSALSFPLCTRAAIQQQLYLGFHATCSS